jgi:hypothetical protein
MKGSNNAAKWCIASASAAAVLAFAGTAHAQTPCFGANGPDVIVGDITGPSNYSIDATKQRDAFSLGTTSCNMGRTNLQWIASTNQHPVIGGSIFKLKNGRFEQLGFSWLKHGFYALSQNLCCSPCSSTDGTTLGVRCSDPYTSSRNGTQGNLGPRWQVNATTGAFVYPPANPSYSGNSARRVQVKLTDLEASSANVIYISEAQYITPDDALAGNGINNVSWRRMTMVDSGGTAGRFNGAFSGNTVRQQAAIQAWKQFDPSVNLVTVDVPADGRYWIGSKVTDNGDGTWSYEYAIQNINSDRSGASFSVPLPDGVIVTDIGFKDVDYLDGDGIPTNPASPNTTARNFDGTDWTGVVSNGAITWTVAQSFAQNTNANALRWGTLYNFRFRANVAPQTADATLGLFKPAADQPASVVIANTQIPGELPCAPCAADFDRDGGVTGTDISAFFADYEIGAACADVDLDGGVTAGDLAAFFSLFEQGGC